MKKLRKVRAWAGLKNGRVVWESLDNMSPCLSIYKTKKAAKEEYYKNVVPVEIHIKRKS